jgi:hypothetical protein
MRRSHVHLATFETCRALRPRERPLEQPITSQRILSSMFMSMSTTPICIISGLNRFNLPAYGLPLSLSTLDPCRYLHEPKTRSQVRWAPLTLEDFHLRSLSASWRTIKKAVSLHNVLIYNTLKPKRRGNSHERLYQTIAPF